VLGEPRANAGVFEQTSNDRSSAIARRTGPSDIDAEATIVERPDREPVGSSRCQVGRHAIRIGTLARLLNKTPPHLWEAHSCAPRPQRDLARLRGSVDGDRRDIVSIEEAEQQGLEQHAAVPS
jgi:hypothetical protein